MTLMRHSVWVCFKRVNKDNQGSYKSVSEFGSPGDGAYSYNDPLPSTPTRKIKRSSLIQKMKVSEGNSDEFSMRKSKWMGDRARPEEVDEEIIWFAEGKTHDLDFIIWSKNYPKAIPTRFNNLDFPLVYFACWTLLSKQLLVFRQD